MSSVPIESSFDGDTSPIGQGSSGNISPRKRTATGHQRCRVESLTWTAPYWHPVQGRLSYSCTRQQAAKAHILQAEVRVPGWAIPEIGSPHPFPDGCAGSSDLSCAASPWGSSPFMVTNRDGRGRKRCKATHGHSHIHTHARAYTHRSPYVLFSWHRDTFEVAQPNYERCYGHRRDVVRYKHCAAHAASVHFDLRQELPRQRVGVVHNKWPDIHNHKQLRTRYKIKRKENPKKKAEAKTKVLKHHDGKHRCIILLSQQ